ncbi:MAG: hypothetical protein U0075_06355 [Thermomicrobiales bacterium]
MARRAGRTWNVVPAGTPMLLGLILLLLNAGTLLAAPATPVAACTGVRAPQPLPTPTRPAWAGEEPQVPLEPVPDSALDPLVPGYLDHAVSRFAACWNAGDWSTVVRGATPRFLTTAFGISPNPAALADLELGPVTLLEISPPRLWSDGRAATEVLYQRGPQVVSERWFFLVMRGDALLDEAVPLSLPPLGDRLVLGVESVDFTAPWAWRGREPEVAPAMPLLVITAANRTPEPRTITVRAAGGAVSGYLRVPAGSEIELGLRNLPAGRYEITSAESPDAEPLTLQIGEGGE